LRLDHGPEFTARKLDLRTYLDGVTPDFSRPGNPTDNAYIESFNRRFREECLSQHYFTSIDDARGTAESWRVDYDERRPHGALGAWPPGCSRHQIQRIR
jgi:putative transposase